MRLRVPHSYQNTDYTCGPECLKMVLGFFGRNVSVTRLAKLAQTSRQEGTSRKMMTRALRTMELRVHTQTNATLRDVRGWISRGIPVIVNYRERDNISHYAVVVGFDGQHISLHDPQHCHSLNIPRALFLKRWYGKHRTVHTRWLLAAHPPHADQTKRLSEARIGFIFDC